MTIHVQHLGSLAYDDAMHIMQDCHAKRVQNGIPDTLLVVEHPPVITRGRKISDLVLPNQAYLESLGVAIRNADRGGELTYHGPGQIVVYFVLRLLDHASGIADLVWQIENIALAFLQKQGVVAEIRKDHPGLWVGEKKIASLGLRVSEGVTKHGISLNIHNDLGVYQWFSPCGLAGSTMTTLAQCLQKTIAGDEYAKMQRELADDFARQFGK